MKIKILSIVVIILNVVVFIEIVKVFISQGKDLASTKKQLQKYSKLIEKINYNNPANIAIDKKNLKILDKQLNSLLLEEKKLADFFFVGEFLFNINSEYTLSFFQKKKKKWIELLDKNSVSYSKNFFSLKVDTVALENYYFPAFTFLDNFFKFSHLLTYIDKISIAPSKGNLEDFFFFDVNISVKIKIDFLHEVLQTLSTNSKSKPYLFIINSLSLSNSEDFKLNPYSLAEGFSYLVLNPLAFSQKANDIYLKIKAKLLIKNELY